MAQLTLNQQYKAICHKYECQFCKLTGKQGEWTADYSVWITEDEAYSFDEVRYVVDHATELTTKYKNLSKELYKWVEYNIFAYEYKINYINLKSWLGGAPRMSEEDMLKIKNLRAKMEKEANDLVEKYGELIETPSWVTYNLKTKQK